MDSMAWRNVDEFIERRRSLMADIQRGDDTMAWCEGADRFLIEAQDTHVILSIERVAPYVDAQQLLLMLYRRAAPQRFMGLPVRVYYSGAALVGALALPWQAVTTGRLMQLHDGLRRMFE